MVFAVIREFPRLLERVAEGVSVPQVIGTKILVVRII
jgi:hypothetical protein